MRYVIMKASRTYKEGAGYAGPTCKDAGVTPGKIYISYSEAIRDAKLLTRYNPAGFYVCVYREGI